MKSDADVDTVISAQPNWRLIRQDAATVAGSILAIGGAYLAFGWPGEMLFVGVILMLYGWGRL